MKITIVGGGNMGGAIALGLAESSVYKAENITVITKSKKREYGSGIRSVVSDYSSIASSDIVVLAVKPWLVEEVLKECADKLTDPNQILISVASGIGLSDMAQWMVDKKPIFRVMPNTAVAKNQSMTFISSLNGSESQKKIVQDLFEELGKVEFIDERIFSAATSLSGCGIAYAFRYIRASVEGAVEMGLYPEQATKAVLQTLRGAIELLEANGTHPEEEIDKVTTPGGSTIKGLNELEHAGFTSAIIRGLKASNVN